MYCLSLCWHLNRQWQRNMYVQHTPLSNMREYDKLEEEEGKRARVVIKWIGKVWAAWEREGERVSEWALGPWLALFFFLSLSLTITLQLNACVCTCRHAYVYVCIMLTHSHMCHTVESPPNREIQWERDGESERAGESACRPAERTTEIIA